MHGLWNGSMYTKSRLQGIDYKSLQECLQSVYKKDIREKAGKNLRADMIQKFINKAATERSKTVASTINFYCMIL